jgi:zinc and cadmium transporter
MATIVNILLATILVSGASMVGLCFVSLREEALKKASAALVAFASGGLIGGAFFHLIPKAYELRGEKTLLMVVLGILFFFILEKGLCWRHCHEANCNVHTFTYVNLVGDAIHNFLDGLIIAAAFLVSAKLGVVTTLVVILHEVPQEIGDFGVLVYGGFSVARALWLNLLSALAVIAGGIVGYFASLAVTSLQPFLLAFAAGSFVYIALADLIPELHKQRKPGESVAQFALMVTGLALLWAAKSMTHG